MTCGWLRAKKYNYAISFIAIVHVRIGCHTDVSSSQRTCVLMWLVVQVTTVAPGVGERVVDLHSAGALVGCGPATHRVQFTAQCAHVEQTALDVHRRHLPSEMHTCSVAYFHQSFSSRKQLCVIKQL